jgi:hypothetical protein
MIIGAVTGHHGFRKGRKILFHIIFFHFNACSSGSNSCCTETPRSLAYHKCSDTKRPRFVSLCYRLLAIVLSIHNQSKQFLFFQQRIQQRQQFLLYRNAPVFGIPQMQLYEAPTLRIVMLSPPGDSILIHNKSEQLLFFKQCFQQRKQFLLHRNAPVFGIPQM